MPGIAQIAVALVALTFMVWLYCRARPGQAPARADPALPLVSPARERRLRSGPALRRLIAILLLTVLVILLQPGLQRLDILFATALAFLVLLSWQGWRARMWELRFDSVGLSVPAGFGRRHGRMWSELTRLDRGDPLSVILHFADGSRLHIPNHIEGRDELLQIADHWLASAQGSAPHAGTSRS